MTHATYNLIEITVSRLKRMFFFLPLDGLDKVLFRLCDDALENFTEYVHRTLFAHCIHVQFLEQGSVNGSLVFDGHFQFTNCFQSTVKPFNLLLIGRI